MKKTIIILTLVTIPWLLMAQTFETYDLNSNWINELKEDSKGTLWFYNNAMFGKGTLVQYDGTEFIVHSKVGGSTTRMISDVVEYENDIYFTNYTGLAKYSQGEFTGSIDFELPYKAVSSAYVDSKSRFWVFPTKLFKGQIGQIRAGKYLPEEGLPNPMKSPNSIFEDTQGNIWIGSHLGGIRKFDGTNWTDYSSQMGFNHVEDIQQDQNGNIWVGSIEGKVGMFDGSSWQNYAHSSGYFYWPSAAPGFVLGILPGVIFGYVAPDLTSYSRIAIDKDNNVWGMIAKRGVYQFKDGNVIDIESQFNLPKLKKIRDLMVDENGFVWLAVGKLGVLKYDGANWETYDEVNGKSIDPISVNQDSSGNIWITCKNQIIKMIPDSTAPEIISSY